MAEQQNKNPSSVEEKVQELFDLLDEKAAKGELNETDEMPAAAPKAEDTSPMSESEAAAFEYGMMMRQYEALLADYQRREAEEQAQKAQADQKPEGDGQARWSPWRRS